MSTLLEWIDWQQILLHVFNFIILAAGLTFLLFKPVRKFMRNREQKYKDSAEQHAKRVEEIAELEKEKKERFAGLDSELAERRKEVLAQTEQRNRQLLSEAERQAESIVAASRRKAEEERAAYMLSAGNDIADMVVKSAGKLLAMESSPESDSALYDSYLKAAESDVSLEGISAEARRTLAGRMAAAAADGAGGREHARATVADMVEDAALKAAERSHSGQSDIALYDEFLKSGVGGSNEGRQNKKPRWLTWQKQSGDKTCGGQ